MAKTSPYFLLIAFLLLLNSNLSKESKCKIFNFGDSNTDTGAGACCNISQPLGPPCRASNGLLYIDYICERLGMDLLLHYQKAMLYKSNNGANFAVYATTIEPRPDKNSPLNVQIAQFAGFQNYTYGKYKLRAKKLRIVKGEFRNAIFSIDIGQNDCFYAATSNSTSQEILEKKIPTLVEQIGDAMKKLYQLGGRKFVIYNTGPLGYLPLISQRKEFFNTVARAFNKHLRLLSLKLSSQMTNAMIIYGDMYGIKLDLITKYRQYGFKTATVPCKVSPGIECGSIFWDEAHYSDAANKLLASKLWIGDHLSFNTSIRYLCNIVI